jgi:hypothetical protein
MVRAMLPANEESTSARKLWNEAPRGVSRKSVDAALDELYAAGYLGAAGVGFERIWGRDDAKAAEVLAQRAFMKKATEALAAKGITAEYAGSLAVRVNMHNLYRLMNVIAGGPADVAADPGVLDLFKAANGNDAEAYDLTPGAADKY